VEDTKGKGAIKGKETCTKKRGKWEPDDNPLFPGRKKEKDHLRRDQFTESITMDVGSLIKLNES